MSDRKQSIDDHEWDDLDPQDWSEDDILDREGEKENKEEKADSEEGANEVSTSEAREKRTRADSEKEKENRHQDLNEIIEAIEVKRVAQEWERKERAQAQIEAKLAEQRVQIFKYAVFYNLDREYTLQRMTNPTHCWREGLVWPADFPKIEEEHRLRIKTILGTTFSLANINVDGPFLMRLCLSNEEWQERQLDCQILLSYHDATVVSKFKTSVKQWNSWKWFRNFTLRKVDDVEYCYFREDPDPSLQSIRDLSLPILNEQWAEYATAWLLHEHQRRPLYWTRVTPFEPESLNRIIADVQESILFLIREILLEEGLLKDIINLVIPYYRPCRIQARLWGLGGRVKWTMSHQKVSSSRRFSWLEEGRNEIAQVLKSGDKTDLFYAEHIFKNRSPNIYTLERRGKPDSKVIKSLAREGLFLDR
jgi:hypothetical protein